MSRVSSSEMGAHYEQLACSWLVSMGLTCLASNYHCKMGEIDLIMLEGEVVVFVEIRYRRYAHFGSAIESITEAKKRRLQRAAEHYLQRQNRLQHDCRFDVVAYTADGYPTWLQGVF